MIILAPRQLRFLRAFDSTPRPYGNDFGMPPKVLSTCRPNSSHYLQACLQLIADAHLLQIGRRRSNHGEPEGPTIRGQYCFLGDLLGTGCGGCGADRQIPDVGGRTLRFLQGILDGPVAVHAKA
jgi:hypothetical protein